jgi:hypothetical protein
MTDDQEEQRLACLKVLAAGRFARDDARPAEVGEGLYVGKDSPPWSSCPSELI